MNHYLDNSATTPLHPEVKQDMFEAMDMFGNPSSQYSGFDMAEDVRYAIAEARATIAQALNCMPDEIYFVSGGTEANNTALRKLAQRPMDNVVCTGYEHPSVRDTIARHTPPDTIRWVHPNEQGIIPTKSIVDAVDEYTKLATFMHCNSETGAVIDIIETAKAIKAKNLACHIHIDAVQSFTKLPIDLSCGAIDTLAVSSHKVGGPKGVGALYVRSGVGLSTLMFGGHQENGLRPGTENTIGIIGFGKAVEVAMRDRTKNKKHIAMLDGLLWDYLQTMPKIVVNSPEEGLKGITNISVLGYKSQYLIDELAKRHVYVSAGSACSHGQPSHTLLAMGLDDSRVESALRISFGSQNTVADVDSLVDGLKEIVGCR